MFVGAGRVLVTAALLFALAQRVDFADAGSLLANASISYLAAAVAMLFAAVTVSTFRWHAILAAQGPTPGRGALLKLSFIGLFFNQVLPTGIGGDSVRAWRCRSYGVDLATAIRSVLFDRISGYLIIVVLYGVGLPWLLENLPGAQQKSVVFTLFALSAGGFATFGVAGFLPERARRLPGLGALAVLSRDAWFLLGQPGRTGIIFALSALATVSTVAACMLVGQSVGIKVSLGHWLLIIGPITVIQLLPVSLAGWGVREIGLVAALPLFGVSPEAAVATSLLIGLCMIAIGLPGGLIWLIGFGLPRAKTEVARSSVVG